MRLKFKIFLVTFCVLTPRVCEGSILEAFTSPQWTLMGVQQSSSAGAAADVQYKKATTGTDWSTIIADLISSLICLLLVALILGSILQKMGIIS